MESQAPRVTVEGFDGPLDLLLELVEEKKLDILTVRLGDLADAYLARVRAMAALPADEVSAFLALASRHREEEIVAPAERYSVEQRTAEIEALVAAQERVSFATLLGEAPTVGFAVVTFIALLDLYRRAVIDLAQDELFADIVITRREATSAQI
ncbi:MAG: hypothetical protein E6I83_06985 [Chloroflexi bacterium]|nr:MAG: hypothetical protein E6I83_06985 [Chloroflexota bacterium]